MTDIMIFLIFIGNQVQIVNLVRYLPQGLVKHIYIISENPYELLEMQNPSIQRYDERFHEIENWLRTYNNMQQEINSRINNSIYSTTLSSENEMKDNNRSSQFSLQEKADSLNSKLDLVSDKCSKNVVNASVNIKESLNNIKSKTDDSVLIKNAGNIFYNMLLNHNVTSKVRDEIISEIVSNLITNYDLFILYTFFEAMKKQFRIQLGIPSEPDDQHETTSTNNTVTRNIEVADKCSQTDLRMMSRHFKPNISKKNNYAYKITKSNYLRREQLCQKTEKYSRSQSAPDKYKQNKRPYISGSEYSEDSEAEQNLGLLEGRRYCALNRRKELKNTQNESQDRNASLKERIINNCDISKSIRVKKKVHFEMLPPQSNETSQMNTRILGNGLEEVTDCHADVTNGESASSLNVTEQNMETLKSAGIMSFENIFNQINEDKIFKLNKKLSKTVINTVNRSKRVVCNSVKTLNMSPLNNTQGKKTNLSKCREKISNEDTSTSENKSKENIMFSSMCTEKIKSNMIYALIDELSQFHEKEINEHFRNEENNVNLYKVDEFDTGRHADTVEFNENMQTEKTDFDMISKLNNTSKFSLILNKLSEIYKTIRNEEACTSSDNAINSRFASQKNTVFYKNMEPKEMNYDIIQVSADNLLTCQDDIRNEEMYSASPEITEKSQKVLNKTTHSVSNQANEKGTSPSQMLSQSVDTHFVNKTIIRDGIGACMYNTGGEFSSDTMSVNQATVSGKTELASSVNSGCKIQKNSNEERPLFPRDSANSLLEGTADHTISSHNKVPPVSLNYGSESVDNTYKDFTKSTLHTNSHFNISTSLQPEYMKSLDKELKLNFKERAQLALMKRLLNGKVKTKKLLKEKAETELQERKNLFKRNEFRRENNNKTFEPTEIRGENKNDCVNKDSKCAETITNCSDRKQNVRCNSSKMNVLLEKCTDVKTEYVNEEGSTRYEPHKNNIQLYKCTEMFINNNKQKGNIDSKPVQTDTVRSAISLDATETQKLMKHTNIIPINSVKKSPEESNVSVLREMVKDTLTIKSSKRLVEGSVVHCVHRRAYKRLLYALFVALILLIYYLWNQQRHSFSIDDIYEYLNIY